MTPSSEKMRNMIDNNVCYGRIHNFTDAIIYLFDHPGCYAMANQKPGQGRMPLLRMFNTNGRVLVGGFLWANPGGFKESSAYITRAHAESAWHIYEPPRKP